MRILERLNGKGVVVSSSGERKTVRYDLDILQNEIPAGTLTDPSGTILGLPHIQGRVNPVCFFGDNELTLEMSDSRKMKFFFQNEHGSIAFRAWVE